MPAKYPEKMRVLTDKDFCRNDYVDGPKRCLFGHLIETFGGTPNQSPESTIPKRAVRLLAKTCKETLVDDSDDDPCAHNDNPDNSFKQLAKVWNLFIAKLGYVVDCTI